MHSNLLKSNKFKVNYLHWCTSALALQVQCTWYMSFGAINFLFKLIIYSTYFIPKLLEQSSKRLALIGCNNKFIYNQFMLHYWPLLSTSLNSSMIRELHFFIINLNY